MFRLPDFQPKAVIESHELTDRRSKLGTAENGAMIEKSREERIAAQDAADLARLGKRQVLKVSLRELIAY